LAVARAFRARALCLPTRRAARARKLPPMHLSERMPSPYTPTM
jgi:hypothetical protein